jgi:release factor H-coupled RctB family protein
LKGVKFAIGMPDLHPGKGFPIGTSFATEGIIYPHLIGSDIGCGMTMYQTKLMKNKIKLEKWANKLYGLETGGITANVSNLITDFHDDDDRDENESTTLPDDLTYYLKKFEITPTIHDNTSLGTIGGGNHFAELQQVQKVENEHVFYNELGLKDDHLFLLVHSGSRGYGHDILMEHEEKYGIQGFEENSAEAKHYLEQHRNACQWAKANRALIADKFFSCIGTSGEVKVDIWHNNVEPRKFYIQDKENNKIEEKMLWLHRKGAAPTDKGCVVIPGSRGSFSYLVKPSTNEIDLQNAGYSCAHGAGRKWKRSKALSMGKNDIEMSTNSLSVTELGSRVICEDSTLMYEEQPAAYKDVDQIVKDLVDFKVVEIVAIMSPLITYKTRATKGK